MSRSLRLLSVLLALLVPAVVLAACGGDDGNEDVNAVLQETFDGKGKSVDSGKLDLSLDLDLTGAGERLDAPLKLTLAGPFENNGSDEVPRFDFNVTLDGGGQKIEVGAVSTGENAYLNFQGQAYEVGDAAFKQFQEGYAKAEKESGAKRDSGPSLASLGVDPRRWLEDPKTVGTEDVGGAETIHITAEVNVPRLLEDVNRLVKSAGKLGVGGGRVPDELTPTERARVADALESATIDIWTGKDDKTLRKLSLHLDVSVPPSERKKAGLAGGKVDLTYAVSDLNEPQKIEEPKDAKPIAELNAALKALGVDLGAATGGASGQTSTTPQGTSTTEQPASQAYFDCREKAGEDAEAAKECVKLLAQP